MSKGFTPGPWKVGGEWPQIVAVYAGSLYIAHANTGAGSDWINNVNPLGRDVAKANAHLIAAAPELLEALEAVELARNTDEAKDWERATKLTDAALAKVGSYRTFAATEARPEAHKGVLSD